MPAALRLRRLSDPASAGWHVALEPTDRSWIAFSDLDGQLRFFARDRDGAAVPALAPSDEVLQ